jgi:hypothetical protein
MLTNLRTTTVPLIIDIYVNKSEDNNVPLIIDIYVLLSSDLLTYMSIIRGTLLSSDLLTYMSIIRGTVVVLRFVNIYVFNVNKSEDNNCTPNYRHIC